MATLNRALAMLKEQAERTPEGQWIRIAGGWNEYQFDVEDQFIEANNLQMILDRGLRGL